MAMDHMCSVKKYLAGWWRCYRGKSWRQNIVKVFCSCFFFFFFFIFAFVFVFFSQKIKITENFLSENISQLFKMQKTFRVGNKFKFSIINSGFEFQRFTHENSEKVDRRKKKLYFPFFFFNLPSSFELKF